MILLVLAGCAAMFASYRLASVSSIVPRSGPVSVSPENPALLGPNSPQGTILRLRLSLARMKSDATLHRMSAVHAEASRALVSIQTLSTLGESVNETNRTDGAEVGRGDDRETSGRLIPRGVAKASTDSVALLKLAAEQVQAASLQGDASIAALGLKDFESALGQASQALSVAERYVCDMHCEPGTVRSELGNCPVCKMALRPYEQSPWALKISSKDAVRPGSPATLKLWALDPAGNAAPMAKPVRVSFVPESLDRILPVSIAADSADSLVAKQVVFSHAGRWSAVAEFTDAGGVPHTISTDFRVRAQDESSAEPAARLKGDYDVVAHVDAYEVRVRCNGQKFFVGEESIIRIGVDLRQAPVTNLQRFPGGWLSEATIASQDLKHFARLTSVETALAQPDARPPLLSRELVQRTRDAMLGNGRESDVVFHYVFPAPGVYRMFVRLKHLGKDIEAAFVIDALLPEDSSEDLTPTGHEHHAKPAS